MVDPPGNQASLRPAGGSGTASVVDSLSEFVLRHGRTPLDLQIASLVHEFGLGALVVVLALAALAAAPFLVDTPRVQALIASSASQALGRPVLHRQGMYNGELPL